MYRLVIVDDFHVEREIAKATICASDLPVVVIGEYSGGREALARITDDAPDIMLVDIEMPGMSGIELAHLVNDLYPQIRIVFFSFYDRFEYIKEAMDLQASGYILKPIEAEEIVSVFRKVIAVIEDEDRLRTTVDDYRKLLAGTRPSMLETLRADLFTRSETLSDRDLLERISYLGLDILRDAYIAIWIALDCDAGQVTGTGQGSEGVEEKEIRAIRVSRVVESCFGRVFSCSSAEANFSKGSTSWLFRRMQSGAWGIQLAGSQGTLVDTASSLSNEIIDTLHDEGISVSIAIGEEFNSLRMTSARLKDAENLMQYRFSKGVRSLLLAREIGPLDLSQENIVRVSDEIAKSVIAGEQIDVDASSGKLFDNPREGNSPILRAIEARNTFLVLMTNLQLRLGAAGMGVNEVFGNERVLWDQMARLESIQDVRTFTAEILRAAVQYVSKKRQASSTSGVIDDVQKYVARNAGKGITVQSVASHFSYNTNYLNNLFKQITGETILDCIMRTRVEEAMRLLCTTNMSIQNICEAVGYVNEAHFKSVFRQRVGMTPKEYRVLNVGRYVPNA